MEDVAVYALEHQLDTVDIQTVAHAELDCPEADALGDAVENLALVGEEVNLEGIKVRMLAVPGLDALPLEAVGEAFAFA